MLTLPDSAPPYNYDSTWFRDIAFVLADSADRGISVRRYDQYGYWSRVFVRQGERQWHATQQQNKTFHPAVSAALKLAPCRNITQLVMEWAHRSSGDPTRLAYTQDERKGEKDIQTVTTVGRYLTRHFPTLSNQVVQDLTYTYNASGCSIHTDAEMMRKAVQEGPVSCMRWQESDIEYRGGHPYDCYAPSLGWSICIRMDGSTIAGRALVYESADEKCFVRTYKMAVGGGYSQADEEMNAYLKNLGYEHLGGWPDGTKLALVLGRNGKPILPYIDGCSQKVYDCGDYFCVDPDGEYECDHTDGNAGEAERWECEECGYQADPDDSHATGRNGDHIVCDSCADNSFTLAYGRRGNQYLCRNDDVITVGDESYVLQFASDNSIVELSNGDYCHQDDACYIERDSEYELAEDCSYCEDIEESRLSCETWDCHASGNTYSDDCESVEIDGEQYHPDHAPEVVEDDSDIPF